MSADQRTEVAIPALEPFMQEVGMPQNWVEFLNLAAGAKTLIQKVGLVHGIFDFEAECREWDDGMQRFVEYTGLDRLKFLFRHADGWTDHYLLETESERRGNEPKYMVGYGRNRILRTASEQRQVLARKNFDMLAAHFFRMPSIQEDIHDRSGKESELLHEFVFGPLFPVVQNFFRVDKDAREKAKIRNLSYSWLKEERSQQEKHATSFLLKLAQFLWSWKKPHIHRWDNESPDAKAAHDKEEKEALTRQAIVDNAKPWMVEILAHLGELRLLERWVLDLDEASLAALKGIALRAEFNEFRDPVSKGRKVATLDEACYLDSPAGWLLKKHELKVRERKRLKEIQELERTREESARKLAQLKKA